MVDTTLVTNLRIIQLHLDVFTTTDKFTLHQFGVVRGEPHFRTQVRKRSFQSVLIFR